MFEQIVSDTKLNTRPLKTINQVPTRDLTNAWLREQFQNLKPNLASDHIQMSAAQNILNKRFNDFVHVIIDPQDDFFNPLSKSGNKDTDLTADNIAITAPILASLGVPTYIVYMDNENEGPDKANGGLYKISAQAQWIRRLLPKQSNSALYKSSLLTELLYNDFSNIILSGGNLTSCMRETTIDALEDELNVWVMPDCCSNDSDCAKPGTDKWNRLIKEMNEVNVTFSNARSVATHLLQIRP